MFGTLMLDETGDIIEAFETLTGGAYTTTAIALGSQQVSQAMSLNTSTKTKDVWFNLAVGVDYSRLVYDTNRNDETLNPIRAQAYRNALENTPGFGSYESTKDVVFTRTDRKLAVTLPCVVIDCDNSRVIPTVIG